MYLAILMLVIIGQLVFSIGFFYSARSKTKRRKNAYERIQKNNDELLSQGRWFPALYCSEERFRKFWKIFPWEAAGILYVSKDKMTFFTEIFSNRNIEFDFNLQNSKVNWIGRTALNGATSWFVINFQGEKHYFSSETGTFVFGSKSTTKQIYDEIIREKGNPRSRPADPPL